jgi:hypothetical protein
VEHDLARAFLLETRAGLQDPSRLVQVETGDDEFLDAKGCDLNLFHNRVGSDKVVCEWGISLWQLLVKFIYLMGME